MRGLEPSPGLLVLDGDIATSGALVRAADIIRDLLGAVNTSPLLHGWMSYLFVLSLLNSGLYHSISFSATLHKQSYCDDKTYLVVLGSLAEELLLDEVDAYTHEC